MTETVDCESVRCRFCNWSTPRFVKSRKRERYDINSKLFEHIRRAHKDQPELIKRINRALAESNRRIREAYRIDKGE